MAIFSSKKVKVRQGTAKVYKFGMGLPVLPYSELLGSLPHQEMLSQLSTLARVTASQYKSLYLPFIQRFSDYAQLLPRSSDGLLLSLLTDSLRRGLYGLTQYKNVTPLEQYALFTAAVLFDIPEVFNKQVVYITDKQGKFIKEWNPFLGNLREAGADYYRLMPFDDYPPLRLSIGILAEKLLPPEGYDWVASDRSVFSDWLLALYGMEAEEASSLLSMMQLLKQQPLQGFPGYELPLLPAFEDKLIERYVDTQDSDDFLNWMRSEIENQRIRVNEDVLLRPERQLFVPAEVVDRFIAQQPITKQSQERSVFYQRLRAQYLASVGGARTADPSGHANNANQRLGGSFLKDIPGSTKNGILIAAALVTNGNALIATVENKPGAPRPAPAG